MKDELVIDYKNIAIILLLIVIFILSLLILNCNKNKVNNTDISTPVGNIEKVDSLIQTNDSIKLVINDLDSVKNAKIIEVQALDNDSTVKLFYELVKE